MRTFSITLPETTSAFEFSKPSPLSCLLEPEERGCKKDLGVQGGGRWVRGC